MRGEVTRTTVFAVLLVAGIGSILIGVSLLATPHVTPQMLVPSLTREAEYCLSCHVGIEEISASHPLEVFGCVSCHGGSPGSLNKESAHRGVVRNPSALDTAATFCGTCHSGQIHMVQRSIQATYAGAITVVRRAFGLQPDGTARYASVAVDHLRAFTVNNSDPQPVQQFAVNCLMCHLNATPSPQPYFYRSTGCASCHMEYASDGLYRGGDTTISNNQPGHPIRHQFTTAIPYTQCNHCHNRGTYDLRTMTFALRDDLPLPADISPDQHRLYDYYQPGAVFTRCEWELDCIDCHTSLEVMGDGQLHNNRGDARYIQCATCHGTLDNAPASATITVPGDMALVRARLNTRVDLNIGDVIMITARGEPLWHIRRMDDQWVLTGKATGTQFAIPLVSGSACTQQGDQQSSAYCHQCHAYNREVLNADSP